MSDSRYLWRIDLFHRILHGVLMLTFLGLAATGLPLKFHDAPWAEGLARAMGGFGAVLFLHKLNGLLITILFFMHLGYVMYRAFVQHERGLFWGPNSLVPQPKDLIDVLHQFRWFAGLGEKARFDRFTYWEKFDYWAVFWGMAIIGTTGYMMWFSSFFARLVPGWTFNIALVIHSEEALLAVWFIFAIHFFNGHLRPEKFPMDMVVFTGRVSEDELRHERPLEYARLQEAGALDALETNPPYRWLLNFGRILGVIAIGIGFFLFGLTLVAF